MLPRVDRLRKMKDFALLSQKGRAVYGPFFTLRFRQSKEQTKIGFVAATKIFKRANKRNRVKRRLREAMALVREMWPKNFDMLFVAKPEAMEAPFEDLKASLIRSFEKMPEAMLKPPPKRLPKARRKSSVVFREPTAK